MVFYIEACESGSMMNHLADNINGEQSVNLLDLNITTCHRPKQVFTVTRIGSRHIYVEF